MSPTIRFGTIEIRPGTRQLLVQGVPATVGARAFDLLLALIERHERLVSKNELLEIVWPQVVVEDGNLHVHVAALRKLLGPAAIVTIPGRGYQFVAALEGAETPSHERSAAAPLRCGPPIRRPPGRTHTRGRTRTPCRRGRHAKAACSGQPGRAPATAVRPPDRPEPAAGPHRRAPARHGPRRGGHGQDGAGDGRSPGRLGTSR